MLTSLGSLVLVASAWSTRPRTEVGQSSDPGHVTLSIVGTNDLHGAIFPLNDRGGVALLGGYMRNLRAVREAEGGALLLIDAGDTFQGGIESNLSEGAVVVDAYNAMGYAAAAIGNHEFDFGAVDAAPVGQTRHDDPRGALKAIASRANFPFLAANLLDEDTGRPVSWPNVSPSAIVEAAGVTVGIIGVMTRDALRSTLAANVYGLDLAPLASTVAAEATRLREQGASLIIVTAHAGGACRRFDDPADLSSCDPSSEIFEVARSLPRGLVDVIVAGHQHAGIAHQVAGIAIIESFSAGRSFGRVDVTMDRRTRRVVDVRIFAPHDLCAAFELGTKRCGDPDGRPGTSVPASYEGKPVRPDAAIVAAMYPALQRVRGLQAIPLEVVLDTPIGRRGDLESPLGNLFADAIREAMGADASIHNNARGGLRADMPAGPLTFGGLYDVFPFDNRLVRLQLTGAELGRMLAAEIRRGRRGALGISGFFMRAGCGIDGIHVGLSRAPGQPIADDELLTVVTTDTLASGSVFGPALSPRRVRVPVDAPVAREVVAEWLRTRGGHVRLEHVVNLERPRWRQEPDVLRAC